MKMIIDVDISKCDFSADVVPYIYGEMSATGMFAFESHLPECETCTDELADVSFARYEVYDWKKLEFDPLPTPRMLPFEDAVAVAAGASWFDGLRSAFGGWLIPSSAFAAVAIGVVVTAVLYFSGNTAPEITKVDVPAPTISQPEPSPQPLVADVETPKEVTGPSVVRAGASKDSPDRRYVRLPKAPTVRTVQAVAKREVKSTVPRLNEFTDDEDTSLRLAMLFDDLDTRD